MNPWHEWIPYGGTWTAFCAAWLAKAGTQVEVVGIKDEPAGNSEILLIGDINEAGGVCDDCTAIIEDWQEPHHVGGKGPTMVTRYRRLVDESDYIVHIATVRITETV